MSNQTKRRHAPAPWWYRQPPMGPRNVAFVLIGLLLLAPACRTPRGGSVAEKRAHVRQMRDETLASFYRANPALRQQVASAPGYAVFTNVSVKIFVVATGKGYGVVHDRKTGRDTFMRMFQAGGGIGMGLMDLRALFIFHDRTALRNFIEFGLQVGGQAEVAATVGDVGVAAGTQASASVSGAAGSAGGRGGGAIAEGAGEGYSIFRLTEAGAAASATLKGTKFWKDGSLN